MSVEVAVRAAVIAALREDPMLMDALNGLFDGAPARASEPYAVVGECLGAEWGAKDVDGRELRLTISLFDAGATPGALAPLLARMGVAMAGLDGASDDWRIVTARLVRSRVARTARGRDGWQAVVDYRLRAVANF
jgi:hypothetical protein